MVLKLDLIQQNYSNIKTKSLDDLEYKFDNTIYSNFGLTEPFQLFTRHSTTHFAKYIRTLYNTKYEKSTERTVACIRDNLELQQAIRSVKNNLEKNMSEIVKLPMKLQLPIDYAHINVQKNKQERAVDDWHFDSTPFVLVTILTDHQTDPGANLLVKKGSNTLNCKLKTPGEACLMQGNQIFHCAQQSLIGERISMVTSFYVDSPYIYDCSTLLTPIQYSFFDNCIEEYITHYLNRLIKNCSINTFDKTQIKQRNKILYMEISKLTQECNIISNRLRKISKSSSEKYNKLLNIKLELQYLSNNGLTPDTIIQLKNTAIHFSNINSKL